MHRSCGVVRSIMPPFRGGDPGSNPGTSTKSVIFLPFIAVKRKIKMQYNLLPEMSYENNGIYVEVHFVGYD